MAVIIIGLAFIAGLRAYRAYENFVRQDEPAAAGTTFQNVPVSFVPQIPEQTEFRRLPSGGSAREIYLQDTSLEPEAEREQARQTLRSIVDDYRSDPKVRAFYDELRAATGRTDIDLAALSGENLAVLLQEYPQMQEVMAQYAKDPEFMNVLQEIFANPQFVRSVAVLQGSGEVKK